MLFLTGFTLVIVGFIIVFLASIAEGGVTGGGAVVVFIGPFPLAIGFGEYAPILLLISVIIAMAMILIALISFRQWRLSMKTEEAG